MVEVVVVTQAEVGLDKVFRGPEDMQKQLMGTRCSQAGRILRDSIHPGGHHESQDGLGRQKLGACNLAEIARRLIRG